PSPRECGVNDSVNAQTVRSTVARYVHYLQTANKQLRNCEAVQFFEKGRQSRLVFLWQALKRHQDLRSSRIVSRSHSASERLGSVSPGAQPRAIGTTGPSLEILASSRRPRHSSAFAIASKISAWHG